MHESLKALAMLVLAIALNHYCFGTSIATPATVFFLWIIIMLIFEALRAILSRNTLARRTPKVRCTLPGNELRQK